MACLTDSTMAAFLGGELAVARLERVRAHLEVCPECRSLMAVVEGEPPGQAADLLPGSVLADTYRILHRIGAGGMSTVHAADHLRLGHRVAIKILSRELRHHGDVVERFAREARVCAALGSPHIPAVFDFNHTPDGAPYMVMELLRGEDLSQRLALDGALPVPLLLDLLGQACQGLAAAHAEGIVHRDIKPSNLFLSEVADGPGPLLKLLDFGISKIKGQLASLTGTQQILGTPGYMSPEMASGRLAAVDARADLFSLGAVAYEALSAARPFAADSVPATLFRIVYEEPAPLQSLRPDLPGGLCQLVGELLQKDPERRPGSALEVKQRLEALPAAAAVAGRLPATRLSLPAAPPRRPLQAPVLAAAVAALALLGGGAYLALRPAPEAPTVQPPVPASLKTGIETGQGSLEAHGTQPASPATDAGTPARPDRGQPARRRPRDDDPLL